ncbi:MAG: tetratricopeptide repeat protein [Pyrinomonadaceae bacterium]|nr:tetratricopeptide repeat protein [Pyrinomonadaceae bacterium]
MKIKLQSLNAVLSIILVWSILLTSVPVQAQDIVTSEDISGGSSVFVFRKSRATGQSKFASRAVVKRNPSQKTESRNSIREQVAKATPQREKVKKVDPNTVAVNNTNKNTNSKNTNKNTNTNTKNTNSNSNVPMISKEQASDSLAGAAEVFMERGQIDQAISYFSESIKLNPQNNPAKLGLSEAYTRKADSVYEKEGALQAERFYNLAISNDSNNAAAYSGLGNIYEETGKDDLALTNYEKALSINQNLTELYAPVGISYYQKGEIAKADEFLTKAVAADPQNEETQFYLGVIRYKQNRDQEAMVALNKSIALNKVPENTAEAHYYLGEIYDRQDKDKDAINEYNQAVKYNPNYRDAWFDLGVSYYNRKRYNDAINAYNQAIRLQNDNYEYYENLGDTYRQLKQYDKAEGPYGLAVTFAERDVNKQADKAGLADLYSKYGFVLGYEAKWGSAIDALNKAVALSPDTVDFTNLGWAYYNSAQIDIRDKAKADKLGNASESQRLSANSRQKLENGRDALKKATAMDQNFFPSFMNLGMTQTELGDYQSAIEALKRCVQLKDKWALAYNELGYAYQVSGKLDDAIQNFRKATDIDKNYSTGLFNLAYTLMQKGDEKEARKVQDRLRKIDPNMANRLEAEWLSGGRNIIKQKVDSKNPLNKIRIPY